MAVLIHSVIEINKVIESAVQDFKPNILFTHSDLDSNNDHRICHRATIMATRPCNPHIVTNLLLRILSSSEWSYAESFKPNFCSSFICGHGEKGRRYDVMGPRLGLSISDHMME